MFLLFSFGCLLLLLIVALANLMFAPRLKREYGAVSRVAQENPASLPLVSVLIPARNESHQIEACVRSILRSDYPRFEVIVADDQSTDATPLLLQHLQNQYGPKLQSFRLAEPPPPGWTGKARTCQELARHAVGEIFIFCDADVEVAPEAIASTVGWLWHRRMDAVTALPRQTGGTLIVRAVVMVVTQFLILATLPLCLVPRTRSASLATGNGQWFAWRRSAYQAAGGHAAVRSSRIEDVAMARAVKRAGGKLVSAVATRLISVKMYPDWAAMRRGFLKNLFYLAGESLWGVGAVIAFVAMCSAAPLLAWILGNEPILCGVLSSVGLLMLVQFFVFRTDFLALLLLPVGVFLALALLCESGYRTRKGQIVWKDRLLPTV